VTAPLSLSPQAEMDRVTADSVVGSVATLASRLSGLVRIVVVAAVLGPTQFANLYQSSNNIPNLTFELLTGALFASLIVPALVRHFDRGDLARVSRVARGFLTLSCGAALALVLVGIAAGPLVLQLLTSGAEDHVARTGLTASWLLLGLLFLQVPLYVVAGMAAAVQNARGRYALAASAPVAENIGIILVMATYTVVFGVGTPSGEGLGAVALLGGGTTGSVLLHAVVQWLGARRCGVRLVPLVAWQDREVRELLRLAVPSLGYAALNVTRYFVILVVAGGVPGGVVAFTLAIAFYNLPVALGTKPVAQAAVPILARAHDRGDTATYSDAFTRSFGLALFLTVPAAVGYVLLSGPLAAAVTFGEMATPDGRELVRLCLLGIGLGLIGEASIVFGTQAAYARRDGTRPLISVALRTGLTVVGLLAALASVEGPGLMLAIGLVVAIGDLVAAGYLCWVIRRPLPRPPTSLGRSILRLAAACLAMAPIVVLITTAVGPQDSQLGSALLVVLAGAAGAVVYLGAQWAMRSEELAGLQALFRRDRSAG
jgi:putative peptidoglycan lipid II flippase